MLEVQHLTSNPKFRVTVLTREEWTEGLGTPYAVTRLLRYRYIWVQDADGYLGRTLCVTFGKIAQ
jgi:hypothetical protein